MARKGGDAMIRCEDVLRELSNYLDDEVDQTLRQELEAHLRGCKRCWVLVDSARKTLRIVAETNIIDLPPGFTERLRARLESGLGQL